jgi:hypothetical protein
LLDSYKSDVYKLSNFQKKRRGGGGGGEPLRGISGFGAMGGWCAEIHDFKDLHDNIESIKHWAKMLNTEGKKKSK